MNGQCCSFSLLILFSVMVRGHLGSRIRAGVDHIGMKSVTGSLGGQGSEKNWACFEMIDVEVEGNL